MWFLRLFVVLVAGLICLGGIGWYAAYLFAPAARRGAAATTAFPATRQTSYERRQHRRAIVLGVGAIMGGLFLVPETAESIRTGEPIHMLNGPGVNGWIGLGAIVLVVALGSWLAGSGLVKISKPPIR